MVTSVSYHSLAVNRLHPFLSLLTQIIVMYGGSRTKYPPRCPFEFMQEPPPVYQKETPKIES